MQDKPIIESPLEVDFYIYPMEYLGRKKHPNAQVSFKLKNRTTKVRLADLIDQGELREQFDHMKSLRFREQDIHYIGGTFEYDRMMFDSEFLKSRRDFRLSDYNLEVRDGQFHLEFSGDWDAASHWETPALATINELYVRALMKNFTYVEQRAKWAQAWDLVQQKAARIKQHPRITFSEFGFRRRAGGKWQRQINEFLAQELPGQYRGTSNTLIAKDLGVTPMGTNAHSIAMLYQGVYRDFDESSNPNLMLPSQMRLLVDWYETFGYALSTFLPDTYGSDYFFSRLPAQMLVDWKGSRQDSGVPSEQIQKMISRYRHVCVDPKTKLVIPSDGLDDGKIVALDEGYGGQINLSYGWGTNLTFDIPGLLPVSLVCKLDKVNGQHVAKLSDNRNKATGDPAAVERIRRLTGDQTTFSEDCRY